ncbi:MAG: ATP synthase F1 subunit delta [Lachnospiraceae bacterium]|nr:ATP synthase F1 subunit delta [Lachnospiraceae bacterium]
MTERSIQYGKVLFELKLPDSLIVDARETFQQNPPLLEALDNPSVKSAEKHAVIDRLFEPAIRAFLKVVTDHQMIGQIDDIFDAYEEQVIEAKNWVKATLYYVTKPGDTQIEGIKAKICKEYNKDGVELELVEQPSLIGGFVLKVHDFETNRSIKGRIEQLTQNLMRR